MKIEPKKIEIQQKIQAKTIENNKLVNLDKIIAEKIKINKNGKINIVV